MAKQFHTEIFPYNLVVVPVRHSEKLGPSVVEKRAGIMAADTV